MFFFISCHLTAKQEVSKKELSQRKIAAIDPNLKASAGASTRPVSTIILFQNEKPICVLSASKRPHLIPSFFKVSAQKAVPIGLPICNQKNANKVYAMSQKSALLDKKGGYQTAGLPVLAPAVMCVAGLATGTFASAAMHANSRDKSYQLPSAGGMMALFSTNFILQVKELGTRLAVQSAGIGGVCAGIGAFAHSALALIYSPN